MSGRAFIAVVALLSTLILIQVFVYLSASRDAQQAVIELHGTSAGIPMAPGDARVLVHPVGGRGQLSAEGASGTPLPVAPGQYNIRFFYQRAHDNPSVWIEDVELSAGESFIRNLDIPAGELGVESVVGAKSDEDQVTVHVYAVGDEDRLITSMNAGEYIVISSGIYDLRVVLNRAAEESQVKWLRQVSVEPGLRSVNRVQFERGALLVRASNGDSQLRADQVELIVFRAGDDLARVVQRGNAATDLALPAGSYDVEVIFVGSADAPVRLLQGVQIQSDTRLETIVEFASGTAIIQARLAGGETLEDYNAYVYLYRKGDHEQAVAYAPAGVPITVSAGTYDIRLSYFRSADQPDVWLWERRITAGSEFRETVAFPSGSLLVRALDAAGEELIGDNVFIFVHPESYRAHPVAVGRGGVPIVLTNGRYDVRIQDTRKPGRDTWIRGIDITAGKLLEKTLTLTW